MYTSNPLAIDYTGQTNFVSILFQSLW